jgi:hypothetical protein
MQLGEAADMILCRNARQLFVKCLEDAAIEKRFGWYFWNRLSGYRRGCEKGQGQSRDAHTRV